MSLLPRGQPQGRRRRPLGTDDVDVDLKVLPIQDAGPELAARLAVQGFCVVDPALEGGAVEKALVELREFEELGRWQKVHRLIQNGLLGPEGSALIAQLDSPDLDDEVRSDGETLVNLDALLSEIGLCMEQELEVMGCECRFRSLALAHCAGEPHVEQPPLTDKQAHHYLGTFVGARVLVLLFLGPTGGVLELTPYSTEDAQTLEVATIPGRMVVLRSDLMSHRHFAQGRSMVISSFFMAGAAPKRQRAGSGGATMTPAAAELNDWIFGRLRRIKEVFKEDSIWDPEVPSEWISAMNHMFHSGQMIAVRGAAFKQPGCDVPETFWKASTTAPDYAVEVPLMRWDHAQVYDPEGESWRQYKTYCKHGSFMDGIEFFDCRMFSMTPNEAKSMDPHQRLILEVGYSALHNMGMRKNTLVNTHCGVYVGCGNSEWNMADKQLEFGAFGATGGALSISSGRFSFTLGLKGPSMTLDTEGSSGATAAYLGAESLQQKGRASPSDIACSIAAHLLLTAVWWPSQCASGWLSREGRCFTFNASADGYIRADGVAAVSMKTLNTVVDGKVVTEQNQPLIGCIAGAMMNNNGCGASLSAPHGPSEQEAITEAIRNANVTPFDVEAVDAHASGGVLSDAIEVGSLLRAHRSEAHRDPLGINSIKSSVGNQVEVGGLTALIRTMYSNQWGASTPTLHLAQANPHMDAFEQPLNLVSDCLGNKMASAFAGVMSRGFGGSNVYLLTWGEQTRAKEALDEPLAAKDGISYWPGGGGKLEADLAPASCYRIVGTWSQWSDAHRMEEEGEGDDEECCQFGFTVVLGENRWEAFQIWLDGDPDRALHPGRPSAPRGSPVYGPEPEAHGLNWLLDGRDEVVGLDSDGLGGITVRREPRRAPDVGRPGDMYRVRLRIDGKWRTVTWDKLDRGVERGMIAAGGQSAGSYFVAGSWTGWEVAEMSRDPSSPGMFYVDIDAAGYGDDFQILRNSDWGQVFYPSAIHATGGEADGVEVLGPDDLSHGLNWHIDSRPGERYRIEFRRVVDDEGDSRSVSWRRLDPGE